MKQILSFPLIIIFLFSTSVLAENDDRVSERVQDWLLLDAVSEPMPAFHDVENIRNNTFGMAEFIRYEFTDPSAWWPESGDAVPYSGNRTLNWQQTTISDNVITLDPQHDEQPSVAWLGFYLNVERYQEVVVHAYSHHPLRMYVNGEGKGVKTSMEEPDAEAGRHAETLKLETGTYFIMVKALHDPTHEADWSVSGIVEFKNADLRDRATITTHPERHVSLDHLSHQATVNGISVSADGERAAVHISQRESAGARDRWVEIRNTSNGELVHDFRGNINPGSLQWAPSGHRFAYTESEGGKTNLWIKNLNTGTQKLLLDGLEDFSGYQWAPDGSFIVYSINEKAEPSASGVYEIKDLPDRRPWSDTRSFLYQVDVESKANRRLTAGLHTTSLNSIHPDGDKLLFSRAVIDYTTRPYTLSEYNILNLNTLEVDSLFTLPFGGGGAYSPDGNYILFTGGPSMFGDIGINVPEDHVANDYDMQAYLYRISDGEVLPITRDFDPAINSAQWDSQGDIYFTVTEKSFNNLYAYNVSRERFTEIETDIDVISRFDVARNARTGVFYGTGLNQISTAAAINLRRERITHLTTPSEQDYKHVSFGDSKDWVYTLDDGTEIDGHIYYPVNFDPDRKYPVIVYYYGGTVPVTRGFGGRYPKEYYAANGYMVYVMQPAGATGFGQDFSALHVNDWGTIVADQIIASTSGFLEAHSYADDENVAAIGASFGGFMTMLLLTKTDMFAAAVSHAGIANITSYWGEGFWGYAYSSVATANSFPWNREDIYIGQSPIFNADKITTPLLLTTGMSDTNVPPGESIQMFTALKLLGRDVAFIGVDDQDHHILEYQKYRIWKRSIVAWFDKHLKDEPEWWQEMYD